MDTLSSMRAFVRVIDLAGFAAAARSLRLSPAMVSKHIAHLERRLGVSLLTRTTRRVTPTEAGTRYHAHCVELLRALDEAESQVGRQAQAPSGTLRVTAPVEFGQQHIAPLVAPLLAAHPELSIALDFTNRVVDLADEGVDVAVRVSARLDTALAGRRLASSRLLVVASPDYLSRHGMPDSPDALARHEALCFAVGGWDSWPFSREGRPQHVKVRGRVRSTSSEALRVAACQGAGITLLPTFQIGADLRRGALVPVLTDWECGTLGVHVLYPQRRHHPARLRVFVEALSQRFGDDPRADPFWQPGP
ncbi:LysR family transcriptional regulator [Caldimonas tepidiphila]|uniref:LysR family transcriptional regulator n=1 Tax=Caldimonas tepidiphila TaxID=2315841 RepID=UPI000E5C5175|nr:LysR family transcriptional regulator [Caldimonas tepidiphila]